jgi:hypothetical protein
VAEQAAALASVQRSALADERVPLAAVHSSAPESVQWAALVESARHWPQSARHWMQVQAAPLAAVLRAALAGERATLAAEQAAALASVVCTALGTRR